MLDLSLCLYITISIIIGPCDYGTTLSRKGKVILGTPFMIPAQLSVAVGGVKESIWQFEIFNACKLVTSGIGAIVSSIKFVSLRLLYHYQNQKTN
jgi:hypothetical protein